jgi:hypothetical protein
VVGCYLAMGVLKEVVVEKRGEDMLVAAAELVGAVEYLKEVEEGAAMEAEVEMVEVAEEVVHAEKVGLLVVVQMEEED